MRVLVVGAGGREHALAWACERYGHTVTMRPALGDVTADDIDLVIPGPEAALVDGIADECSFRTIPCFGPTSKQARIESSKGFSRHLATTLGGLHLLEPVAAAPQRPDPRGSQHLVG